MAGALPASIRFPEPGAYLKWYDHELKVFKRARLVDYEYPLFYQRRLGNLAVGSKYTNAVAFKDLNPSSVKDHRYLAYLGLSEGAVYELYHPYDRKRLQWDKTPPDNVETEIEEKLHASMSPLDYPSVGVWIAPDLYPALNALNISDRTINPVVEWTAAKYRIKQEADFNQEDRTDLLTGRYEVIPVNFGVSV